MNIQSIRLSLPGSRAFQEKQSTNSLILRSGAMGLGVISLLIGGLALGDVSSFSSLGLIGGVSFQVAGGAALLAGFCVKSVVDHAVGSAHVTTSQQRAEPYSLEAVIQRIRDAREQGLKIALFVGRGNDQEMPPKEEEWVWFSLDERMDPTQNTSHHLQLNFNNPTQIESIKSLFNKVVVDLSVLHFFDRPPWRCLKHILVPDPSSQLITDAWSHNSSYCDSGPATFNYERGTLSTPFRELLEHNRIEDASFQIWKNKVGVQKAEGEYTAFLQQLPAKDKRGYRDSDLRQQFQSSILKRENRQHIQHNYVEDLLVGIQRHLSNLFQEVELRVEPYPYRNEKESRNFWVMKGPL